MSDAATTAGGAGRATTCVVLAAGAAFSLYLQSLPREGVFYSCDGGVKFLLVEQLARRGLSQGLGLDAAREEWAEQCWNDGYYPMRPPFVYERGGRRYVEYPPFFCLATAPLYAALGTRGLYVLPLLSTWGVWLVFLAVARRMKLAPGLTAAGLAALIFGTPLTLYSAMFWEHAPAALLAFAGVLPVLKTGGVRSATAAGACGAALAWSAWLRPELLLLAGITAAAAVLDRSTESAANPRRAYVTAIGVGVAVYAAWNRFHTGAWLGFQGLQVTAAPALDLTRTAETLREHARLVAEYAPLAAVAVPALLLLRLLPRARSAVDPADARLAVASVVFLLSLAVVFPNAGGAQWGPRYLLALMPPLLLGALRLLTALGSALPRRLRRAAWAPFAAAAALGAAVNSVAGPQELGENYAARVAPLLRHIERQPHTCIATNTPFVAMELTATFQRRHWFLAADEPRVAGLARRLVEQGEERLLYVTYPFLQLPAEIPFTARGRPFMLATGTPTAVCASLVYDCRMRPADVASGPHD